MNVTSQDRDNLYYLLMRAIRWLERSVQHQLSDEPVPTDLTPSQIMLLANLGEAGAPLSELARTLAVSRQAVHQMVQPLIRDGLVELVDEPGHGRIKRVRLTRTGARIDRRAVTLIHELEDELSHRIGARNLAGLRRALEADWGETLSREAADDEQAPGRPPRHRR